jgi:hypothetical protein
MADGVDAMVHDVQPLHRNFVIEQMPRKTGM